MRGRGPAQHRRHSPRLLAARCPSSPLAAVVVVQDVGAASRHGQHDPARRWLALGGPRRARRPVVAIVVCQVGAAAGLWHDEAAAGASRGRAGVGARRWLRLAAHAHSAAPADVALARAAAVVAVDLRARDSW